MAISRQIIVRRDGRSVLSYTVKEGVCSVGRSPENDLVLPDAAVSPHHAELRVEATAAVSSTAPPVQVASSAAVLVDLESDSGTFVAGARLLAHQPRAMEHGDVIAIGPYELLFRSQAQDGPVAAVPDGAANGSRTSTGGAELLSRAVDAGAIQAAGEPAGPRPTSRYMRYLPIIFHEDDFLGRFLQLFEAVWEPLEQRQDHIEVYFNVATCPVEWLPWMASWFGVELEDHWPEARKRALLGRVMDVYRWRGTAYGLEQVIEACTGARPRIGVSPDNPFVFRVSVRQPVRPDPYFEHDLNEVIKAHKPAHTGYTLEILQ